MRRSGVAVSLPPSGERLVALLALRRQAQELDAVARAVWPGTAASPRRRLLETLLARMPDAVAEGIDVDGERVVLDGAWEVDLDRALEAARRLYLDPRPVGADLLVFRLDLLPGWSAPWLDEVQARYRRVRMSVLRRLGPHQLESGEVDDAVDIALELVAEDPYSEEAQLLLARALVARGDVALARRLLDRFRHRHLHEIGAEPSPRFRSFVARIEHPTHDGAAAAPIRPPVAPVAGGRAPARGGSDAPRR